MESSEPTETAVSPAAPSFCESQPVTPIVNSASNSNVAVTSPVSSPVSSPVQFTSMSVSMSPKPAGVPPGYKLIKRRKEDGTFITVMRKMSPQELEVAEHTGSGGQGDQTTPVPNFVASQGVKYRIVTVRDSNGALIRVKRPIKPEDASSTLPPSSPDKGTSESKAVKPNTDAPSSSTDGTPSKSSETSPSSDNKAAGVTRAPEGDLAVVQEESIDKAAALAQQKEFYRQKRMHRMKGSLLRGFGTVLGSSIGHMDFDDDHHGSHEAAGDIEDGDIIDSDQSWSDDDDDDHGGNDNDHDDGDEQHHESPTQVHFDAAGAAGGAITALATQAASAPPKPAPNVQTSAAEKEATDKNKTTYKVTAKDLDDMDKKAADKDLERPLRHHWATITFYLMGSLSIVLPLLFLLLAIFIFAMKDKPIDSAWHVMPEVIKVGISAWPIVFAAVVAQVFKAYATWRVERGIKLMQLEQLVGSNSFGSAIKQPMVLRQLDTLSLMLLLTWCLSPFGSQALQRTYHTGFAQEFDTAEVYYLKQTGSNKVFAEDWANTTSPTAHAADNQMTAIIFMSTLVPWDETGGTHQNINMDQYDHPILYKPGSVYDSSRWELDTQGFAIAGMGIPLVLPDTKLPINESTAIDTASLYEYLIFTVTSSYFDFTCGDFSAVNYSTVIAADPSQEMAWSSSHTLGMKFTAAPNQSTISHLVFASANLNATDTVTVDPTTWEYSMIECDFEQRFINSSIKCERYPSDPNGFEDSVTQLFCWSYISNFTSPAIVESQNMGTQLENFADDWTTMASPRNTNKTGVYTTPTELFINSGVPRYDIDGPVNLTYNVYPNNFQQSFAYLFNTWVGVGYCPQCSSIMTPEALADTDAVKDLFIPVNATRQFSGRQVYLLSIPWTIAFLISTVLLLVAGIISVIVESITVAPDTLGYVSTVARNSRYLHVKPTSGAMTGAERARKLANTKVMMQDVKANADVGKIALGLKSEKAVQLQANRLYR